MDLIPHTQFSTDLAPEEDRFDLWRDSISVLYKVEKNMRLETGAFQADVSAFMYDQVMISKTSSQKASYQRLPKDIRTDGIDMIMVVLFASGGGQIRTAKHDVLVQAGDIVIYDLGKEAHNRGDFSQISQVRK